MHEIEHFWYISHVDNVQSILKFGILCRNEIEKNYIANEDISNLSVQWRRKQYHNYVPLFFADNTPMLYRVYERFQEKVCLLKIKNDIMKLKGIKYCNGNAASEETVIGNSLSHFSQEHWNIIYSRWPAYSPKWKRIRSAEILVPKRVASKYIKSIHVATLLAKVQISLKINFKVPVFADLTQQGVRK